MHEKDNPIPTFLSKDISLGYFVWNPKHLGYFYVLIVDHLSTKIL